MTSGISAVIHRMYRSPIEYAATLGRGNPDDDRPFKLNREGYRIERRRKPPQFTIPAWESWGARYARLVERCEIGGLIREGRAITVKRGVRTIQRYKEISPREDEPMARPFRFLPPETLSEPQVAQEHALSSAEG